MYSVALIKLLFRQDMTVCPGKQGVLVLQWPEGQTTVEVTEPSLQEAVHSLIRGATEEELFDQLTRSGDPLAASTFFYFLENWKRLCLITSAVVLDGHVLLTLVPLMPEHNFTPDPALGGALFLLSRFAYFRREGCNIVLESSLAPGRILLEESVGVALLAGLACPRMASELAAICQLPEELVVLLLNLLVSARMVTSTTANGETLEDANQAMQQWEFADLLLHTRTRGRGKRGATYRFVGQINPLPVIKPRPVGPSIELYRPDLERLMVEDHPFTWVLEQRRSLREYTNHPINDRQLGEFFYRAARVKEVHRPIERLAQYQLSRRPYPSSGANYELELYLGINRCENIVPGLYHYDPLQHLLTRMSPMVDGLQHMLKMAVKATGQPLEPQVLIILAARFARTSWKYEGTAYSLILKDVGVLYQTMYLVATSMGLAGCALGGGDSDLFATVSGLDYYMEGAVGEFLLGSSGES